MEDFSFHRSSALVEEVGKEVIHTWGLGVCGLSFTGNLKFAQKIIKSESIILLFRDKSISCAEKPWDSERPGKVAGRSGCVCSLRTSVLFPERIVLIPSACPWAGNLVERQSEQKVISLTPWMASGLLCPVIFWHCSLNVKTVAQHNVQTLAKEPWWPFCSLGYQWATQTTANSRFSEKLWNLVHIHTPLGGNSWFYMQWIHTTELP